MRRVLKAGLRFVDVAAAVVLGSVVCLLVAVRFVAEPKSRRRPHGEPPRLLVLDTSYTLRQIRERGLEYAVLARDLDGYFDHVWSVHPLVGASSDHEATAGAPEVTDFDARHTFIQGHVGRYPKLLWAPLTNFLLAQASLVFRLRNLIVRRGIRAVRVGDPYYLGLVGLLLARTHRIPMVVRVNGNYDAIYRNTGQPAYPRLFRSRRVEKLIERAVLARADLVAAANDDNLEFATANGARMDRTAIFPYGNLIHPVHHEEPTERGPLRRELGIGAGHPVLACVTRLEPVKHPDDLLTVTDLLHRAGRPVTLVAVGDGSQRKELLRHVSDLGLEGHVHLVGNQNQSYVARCLADADVILAPMMGRALVEAALSATPIVAYDVDWHAEFIRSGWNGVLVPYRDVASMAEAAASLLDDREEARRLGASARAEALDRLDPGAVTDQERAAYQQLLGRA